MSGQAFVPEPGERVLLASKRSTNDAGAGSMLIMVYGVMLPLMIVVVASLGASVVPGGFLTILAVVAVLTLGIGGPVFAAWRRHQAKVHFYFTDRRLVALRFASKPLEIPVHVLIGAELVYATLKDGSKVITDCVRVHHHVISKSTGTRLGSTAVGFVESADELVALVQSAARRDIDLTALPGANGEPSRAEARDDVFFAKRYFEPTPNGVATRGVLFIGPKVVVAFATPFVGTMLHASLSTAGANAPADQVEATIVDLTLAAHAVQSGAAVIYERDSLSTLEVRGTVLTFDRGHVRTNLGLAPEDAERAARFLKPSTQAYR